MLEGSVRRAAGRLRLTAQLIEGTSGNHVWAKRYDREVQEIFAVQDDLTESMMASVVPEIGKAERERARRKHPASLNAWDCYQRGLWHLYNQTGADFLEAERLFKQALDLDPNLVGALCSLSEAYVLRVLLGIPRTPMQTENKRWS